jgi:site-specific DNA-cytosine methylase
MDRIKTVGNAVDPRVSEWIGRRILACAIHEPQTPTMR